MTKLTDDELLAWLNAQVDVAAKTASRSWSQFAQLEGRLRELLAAQEWQPIESAPRDGTRILIWPKLMQPRAALNFVREKRAVIGYWHTPGNSEKPGMWIGAGSPTHWRRLPPPPKTEDDGE